MPDEVRVVRAEKGLHWGTITYERVAPRAGPQVCPMNGTVMVVPSWGRPCGVAEYARSLTAALEGLGHPVEVVGSVDGLEQRARGRRVHLQYEYSLHDPTALRELLRRLHRRGRGVVVTAHSFAPELADHNALICACSRIIVHSELVRRGLIAAGADPGRIELIAMPTPRPAVVPREGLRRELGVGDGPAVGFFGFAYPHKAMIPLLDAVAKLQESRPELGAVFLTSAAPNDTSRRSLAHFLDHLRERRLGGVTMWEGYLPEEEAVRRLSALDLVVLPYREHRAVGTSAAVRVALAAARPVLVTDTSFFSDLGPEVRKLPAGDADTIAAGVAQLLGDPAAQAALIQAARAYCERHTWEAAAARHLAVYLG